MRSEAGVGEDFEGGEVAKLSVSVFANTGDDGFDMGFGDVAPLDVGEGTTDPFVVLFSEAGKGLEQVAHRSEFADSGVGFSFGVVDVGFVHHDQSFGHCAESKRDIFAGFVGGVMDGFFDEEEELLCAFALDFIAMMEPGEKGVAHEEESGFEFVAVT